VRGVFEELGFDTVWHENLQQAVLTRGDITLVITPGSDVFTANGREHLLEVPAQIINGRIMLPVRAVAESAGYAVIWYPDTATAYIHEFESLEMYFTSVDFIEIYTTEGGPRIIRKGDEVNGLVLERIISSETEFYRGTIEMHEFVHAEFSGEVVLNGTILISLTGLTDTCFGGEICPEVYEPEIFPLMSGDDFIFSTYDADEETFAFAGEYIEWNISNKHNTIIVNTDFFFEFFDLERDEFYSMHIEIHNSTVKITDYTVMGNRRVPNRSARLLEIISYGEIEVMYVHNGRRADR
jgi:hypothetical protein